MIRKFTRDVAREQARKLVQEYQLKRESEECCIQPIQIIGDGTEGRLPDGSIVRLVRRGKPGTEYVLGYRVSKGLWITYQRELTNWVVDSAPVGGRLLFTTTSGSTVTGLRIRKIDDPEGRLYSFDLTGYDLDWGATTTDFFYHNFIQFSPSGDHIAIATAKNTQLEDEERPITVRYITTDDLNRVYRPAKGDFTTGSTGLGFIRSKPLNKTVLKYVILEDIDLVAPESGLIGTIVPRNIRTATRDITSTLTSGCPVPTKPSFGTAVATMQSHFVSSDAAPDELEFPVYLKAVESVSGQLFVSPCHGMASMSYSVTNTFTYTSESVYIDELNEVANQGFWRIAGRYAFSEDSTGNPRLDFYGFHETIKDCYDMSMLTSMTSTMTDLQRGAIYPNHILPICMYAGVCNVNSTKTLTFNYKPNGFLVQRPDPYQNENFFGAAMTYNLHPHLLAKDFNGSGELSVINGAYCIDVTWQNKSHSYSGTLTNFIGDPGFCADSFTIPNCWIDCCDEYQLYGCPCPGQTCGQEFIGGGAGGFTCVGSGCLPPIARYYTYDWPGGRSYPAFWNNSDFANINGVWHDDVTGALLTVADEVDIAQFGPYQSSYFSVGRAFEIGPVMTTNFDPTNRIQGCLGGLPNPCGDFYAYQDFPQFLPEGCNDDFPKTYIDLYTSNAPGFSLHNQYRFRETFKINQDGIKTTLDNVTDRMEQTIGQYIETFSDTAIPHPITCTQTLTGLQIDQEWTYDDTDMLASPLYLKVYKEGDSFAALVKKSNRLDEIGPGGSGTGITISESQTISASNTLYWVTQEDDTSSPDSFTGKTALPWLMTDKLFFWTVPSHVTNGSRLSRPKSSYVYLNVTTGWDITKYTYDPDTGETSSVTFNNLDPSSPTPYTGLTLIDVIMD